MMRFEGMSIRICDGEYSICRSDSIPDIGRMPEPVFVARTRDEISVVCRSSCVPEGVVEASDGWSMLRVEGVLDFSLVGVLSRISSILADSGISLFAVSTFLTDYILVRTSDLKTACDALTAGGYGITEASS